MGKKPLVLRICKTIRLQFHQAKPQFHSYPPNQYISRFLLQSRSRNNPLFRKSSSREESDHPDLPVCRSLLGILAATGHKTGCNKHHQNKILVLIKTSLFGQLLDVHCYCSSCYIIETVSGIRRACMPKFIDFRGNSRLVISDGIAIPSLSELCVHFV